MPRDKTATHLKVLEAAREEFMEYGYENASMRRIGQRCGMTAAGLYRHCRDKAGLFGELVYPNMEEYRLLLTKAKGSPYENFLHDLTIRHQEQMLSFLPMLREKGYAPREIDPKELHLLLSAYTTAIFEPVVHGYSMEEAYRCLETLEAFFLPGWKQLLGY